ncbi:serine aminopeptidase domain-containing protein [Paludisphaera mucosa]|uniref:Alpha/beta hydrolase n=1 Tax=Paludisphaera mucosa TaxID=3030827 RepID=A0ABT6FF83_9BACT|nr:alpha/beta hydrolase [Paludisphaera mucosa]MDG3006058.1 alpha/beta hydrolase [Paludisphaera mucosa]
MTWFRKRVRKAVINRTEAVAAVEAITGAGGPTGGLVLVADGIGGLDLCGRAMARVVRAAGLPYTTWTVPWGHGPGRWYADLSDAAGCEARAADVAETIRLFHARRPDVPIFLVGKSGGCAVMVKALEGLDEPVVERAVLLAPALSPGYDLTRALERVRAEVVVHWSPFDVFFLGLGTGVFGTSDRIRGRGAGLVGFRTPGPADDPRRLAAYRKLRQVRWAAGMSVMGYFGGHLGPDSPRFLARYVVPLLRVGGAPGA